MHLVIDGYNLIKQSPELAMADAMGQGVEALATALNLYRRKKSHKITLVLDGGPDDRPSRHAVQGIPVVMAGALRSADDVIADMAGRHGPGLTVVTDDRELSRRCSDRGSEVIGAGRFADRLMRVVVGGGAEAIGDEGPWDGTTKKKGPSKRLPKAQRRRKKAMDRL